MMEHDGIGAGAGQAQGEGKIRKGRIQTGTADLVIADYITGVQHLGVLVRGMDRTLKLHGDLGFGGASSTQNNEKRVVFVKRKDLVAELYEEDEIVAKPDAIDYAALNVADVERAFGLMGALGYEMLGTETQLLLPQKHGIKFLVIIGSSGEKVEFSQRMQ